MKVETWKRDYWAGLCVTSICIWLKLYLASEPKALDYLENKVLSCLFCLTFVVYLLRLSSYSNFDSFTSYVCSSHSSFNIFSTQHFNLHWCYWKIYISQFFYSRVSYHFFLDFWPEKKNFKNSGPRNESNLTFWPKFKSKKLNVRYFLTRVYSKNVHESEIANLRQFWTWIVFETSKKF